MMISMNNHHKHAMCYQLSFLDADGRIEDICEADVATGDIAIRWMQMVGWAWARHYDWSVMELRCQGRLVARVPALMLDTSVVHAYQQAATAIGQYVEGISPLSGAEDMTEEGVAPRTAPGLNSTLSR